MGNKKSADFVDIQTVRLFLINGLKNSPGEITMKLKQPWKSEFTDHASAAYQILAGNLATAVSQQSESL